MASRGADADVLVIGAGLAGLAAAHRLTQAGLRALVLERESEPGGRARSEQWEGCTIEFGATLVIPAYRRLRRLIEECELDAHLAPIPNVTRIAIRRSRRWHHLDLRSPGVAVARYGGLDWREKAALTRLLPSQIRVAASTRFFDLASAAAVDSRPLEEVIGPAANRYFASALAEVLCGYPTEEVSVAFGVLGTRYPVRRAWALRGGLGSLTGELARRLAVRCGAAVEAVRADGREVVIETSDGKTLRASAAILATRASEALELWPEAPEPTSRFLSGQAYTEGFGVYLRTSAPVRRTDPRGRQLFMEVVPHGERAGALQAVVYLNDLAAEGGLLGVSASPEAVTASTDDGELTAQLETELAQLHPGLQPQVTARRPMRWPIYMPAYPVGRARELATVRARFAPGPVQLAGDYLYGPMMESAVQAGQEAAGRASRYVNSGS